MKTQQDFSKECEIRLVFPSNNYVLFIHYLRSTEAYPDLITFILSSTSDYPTRAASSFSSRLYQILDAGTQKRGVCNNNAATFA